MQTIERKAPLCKGGWRRRRLGDCKISIIANYIRTIPPSFATQNPPPFTQGRLSLRLNISTINYILNIPTARLRKIFAGCCSVERRCTKVLRATPSSKMRKFNQPLNYNLPQKNRGFHPRFFETVLQSLISLFVRCQLLRRQV